MVFWLQSLGGAERGSTTSLVGVRGAKYPVFEVAVPFMDCCAENPQTHVYVDVCVCVCVWIHM